MKTGTETRALRAPVTVVDVIAPDDAWNGAWGAHPLSLIDAGEDTARCWLCNQPIAWRVIVKDADGHHVIGRDCAATIGSFMGRLVSRATVRAEARDAAERRRIEAVAPLLAFVAEHRDALAALPHPMRTRGSRARPGFETLTLADYGDWWADNAGAAAADLRRVLGALREALGIKTTSQTAQQAERRAEAERLTAVLRCYHDMLQDGDVRANSVRRAITDTALALRAIAPEYHPEDSKDVRRRLEALLA